MPTAEIETEKVSEEPKEVPELKIPADVCAICGGVFDPSNEESTKAHAHAEFEQLAEATEAMLEGYVAYQKSFSLRFRTGAREKKALEMTIKTMEARGGAPEIIASLERELELTRLEGRKVKGMAFERRRVLFGVNKKLQKYIAEENFRKGKKAIEKEIDPDFVADKEAEATEETAEEEEKEGKE